MERKEEEEKVGFPVEIKNLVNGGVRWSLV